jgi:hypothetical protein
MFSFRCTYRYAHRSYGFFHLFRETERERERERVFAYVSDREKLRKREREKELAHESEREREKERGRERERERESVCVCVRTRASAYVVSRFPQTHTVVPGFALHENTCLYEQVLPAELALLQLCCSSVAALLQLRASPVCRASSERRTLVT